jgi:hypothetical protein
MLRICKPGLQCGLCNSFIPSPTRHEYCPVRSRSALHAAQAAHMVCAVMVFKVIIVMLSFKVAVAMIDNATMALPLVSSLLNSQRVRAEDKCSSAIVRLDTGSLCSILPFALHVLNSCHNVALALVCLQ